MAGRRTETRSLLVLATSMVAIVVLIVSAILFAPQPIKQASTSPSIAEAPSPASPSMPTDRWRPPRTETPAPASVAIATDRPFKPVPTPTIAFDSLIHDYEVRYPDGWSLTPSKQSRDPDVIVFHGYRWTGSAHALAKGVTLEGAVRADGTDLCTAPWEATAIDGRRALRRAGCGRFDAITMVGTTAYVFSLNGSGPFDRSVLALRIGATIELPEPFTSSVHDYTLMMPPAWDVEPAEEAPAPDRFYGPRHLRLTMAMHRGPATTDAVEWASALFPRRSTGVYQYCQGRSGAQPAKDRQFRRSTIDGFPAAVRSSCGYVDAAIVVRDRIYELTLASPHVASAGDDAAYSVLAPRIDVGTTGGGSPVWSGTFRSTLHGYVLHYPRDWDVSAASKSQSRDVFHAERTRTKLSITVGPKPGSRPLDAYADALLPHHVKGDGCQMGNTWIPLGPEPFRPVKIAKHDAVVRTECDFIEAVVDLDDRALVLVFHSGKRMPGAEQSLFDQFIAGLQVTASS
ncbi:MAG TPA: hypothetical protein VFN41_02655 [Candidatus Limnocylindrales bacterium]|nr:hypothetical protein [Candidatus Limnocylindrales bacterium]